MELKIRQMYLGDNQYRFELLDDELPFKMEQTFEISDLSRGQMVEFRKELYYIEHVYDCPDSPEEDEVVYYILKPVKTTFKVKLMYLDENE